MKIGILSDTHGNIAATAEAAGIFLGSGAEAVFHCGDIGGMDVLAELAGTLEPRGIPIHAVLGNVDLYSSDWRFFPTAIGVVIHGRFADVEYGGKRIALLHSDDLRLRNRTVSSGEYDLVLTGHTHEVHDFHEGQTRCINPGAAGSGAHKTCAMLDLESGSLTIYPMS